MITTRHDVLSRLSTDDVKAAIEEINQRLAEVTLDDLDFDCDDQVVVDITTPLSITEQELVKHQLEQAGWKTVRVYDNVARFYF